MIARNRFAGFLDLIKSHKGVVFIFDTYLDQRYIFVCIIWVKCDLKS